MASRDRLVQWGRWARQVLKVMQDQLGHKAFRDRKVLLGHQVKMASRDQWVPRAPLDLKGLRDHRVNRVRLVLQGRRDRKDQRGRKARKVQKDHKDLKVLRGPLAPVAALLKPGS